MAWTKGQSGNPGGRPRIEKEVRELAQTNALAAMEKLVAIAAMEDPDTLGVQRSACLDILKMAGCMPKESSTAVDAPQHMSIAGTAEELMRLVAVSDH